LIIPKTRFAMGDWTILDAADSIMARCKSYHAHPECDNKLGEY
jgi:hypothetical protein